MKPNKPSKLYCCCNEAATNCYLTCARGRKFDPDHVIHVPQWPKKPPRGVTV